MLRRLPSGGISMSLALHLALHGVAYRPVGAAAVLRRNLFIYGLGGVLAPFIGIKLIDIVVTFLHLV